MMRHSTISRLVFCLHLAGLGLAIGVTAKVRGAILAEVETRRPKPAMRTCTILDYMGNEGPNQEVGMPDCVAPTNPYLYDSLPAGTSRPGPAPAAPSIESIDIGYVRPVADPYPIGAGAPPDWVAVCIGGTCGLR